MDGAYVPENTYLELLSEFRKLKEKTAEDCRVSKILMRMKDHDQHLPILHISQNLDGGVTVIVGGCNE